MVIVKEAVGSKQFNDLFAEEIAELYLENSHIVLEFLKQFSIGRGKVWKKGNTLRYEIFTPKDLKD